MQVFTYVWLNIPSGKRGEKLSASDDEMSFLRDLDKWNSSQPGVWQYYRKPGSMGRPITTEERNYWLRWGSIPNGDVK